MGGWELRVCVAGINLTNLSCRFVAVAAGPFLAACDPFVTFDKKIAEITAESLRGGFWAVLGRLAASGRFLGLGTLGTDWGRPGTALGAPRGLPSKRSKSLEIRRAVARNSRVLLEIRACRSKPSKFPLLL